MAARPSALADVGLFEAAQVLEAVTTDAVEGDVGDPDEAERQG